MRTKAYTESEFVRVLISEAAKAGYHAEPVTVPKVNGGYRGISLRRTENGALGTVMHISGLFGKYLAGETPDKIAGDMIREAEKEMENIPDTGILKAGKIDPESIQLEAVNTENNQDFLADVPHLEICDLSIIFRIGLDEELSTVLNRRLSEAKLPEGMGEKEMRRLMQEASVHHPAVIRSMRSVLGVPAERTPEDEIPMYVASAAGAPFGAGILGYPGFFRAASEKMQGSYWILPSSLYELLLIPDDGSLIEKELYEMVFAINREQVRPEEKLSDNVYHFDPEGGIFRDYFGRTCRA